MKRILLPMAAMLLGAGSAFAAANVFASGLKAENGKISFILNDAAEKVVLNIIKNDAVVKSVELGTGVKGLNSIDIPAVDIEAGTYNWSLTVSAAAITEPTLFTEGSNEQIQLSSGKSISADTNPANSTFGNLYVSSPNKGSQTGARVAGGIYAFNAALQPLNDEPYTGGIEWAEESTSSPMGIDVAANGQVFICDWSDAHGGAWIMDGANPSADFQPVFATGERAESGLVSINGTNVHGSLQDIAVYGDGDARMLYTDDEDLNSNNGEVFVYAIGNLAKPWDTAPTAAWGNCDGKMANANQRIASDRRGGLWASQYRWHETEANPQLMHANAQGVWDFTTGDMTVVVGGNPVGSLGVNADGSIIAVGGHDNGLQMNVASVSFGDDGVPALTKLYEIPFGSYGKRPFDITFDAADNIYVIFNNADATGGIAGWALPKEKNEFTTTAIGTIAIEEGAGISAIEADGTITFEAGVISAPLSATVYSATGAMVAQGNEINTNGWAAGVYIVRMGAATLKIAK